MDELLILLDELPVTVDEMPIVVDEMPIVVDEMPTVRAIPVVDGSLLAWNPIRLYDRVSCQL